MLKQVLHTKKNFHANDVLAKKPFPHTNTYVYDLNAPLQAEHMDDAPSKSPRPSMLLAMSYATD